MVSNAKTVSIRVAVEDADKAVAALNRVGIAADKNFQKFDKSAGRAGKGAQDLNTKVSGLRTSMRNLGSALAIVEGPLGGTAARFNTFQASVGRSGIAIGALVGVLAAATVAIGAFATAGARAESQQLKLEALIKATGGAAGLTADQLQREAEAVGAATLASVAGVREAQGVLLTYRSISGETFNEAIRLSQDLAAVFGGDVARQAQVLGKALEDPITGLQALRRVGVTFSQSQKDVIAALVETGDVAGAQRVILDELANQVGGAGAAAGGGLAGRADLLAQEWGLLLEEFGKTDFVMGTANAALGTTQRILAGIRKLAADLNLIDSSALPPAEEIKDRERALQDVQKVIAQLEKTQFSPNVQPLLAFYKNREQQLLEEIGSLSKQINDQAFNEFQALEDKRLKELQDQNDKVLDITAKTEEERLRLKENAEERIRLEAKKTIDALEANRNAINTDDVDAAIRAVERLRDARLAATDAQAKARREAERAAVADAKLIEGLEFELEQMQRTNKERFVQIQLRQLNAEATSEEAKRVRELAEALFDAQIAEKEQKDAARDLRRREAEELERARDHARDYAEAIVGIGRDFSAGASAGEVFINFLDRLSNKLQEQFLFQPLEDALTNILTPTAFRSERENILRVILPGDAIESYGEDVGRSATDGIIRGVRAGEGGILSIFAQIFGGVRDLVGGILQGILSIFGIATGAGAFGGGGLSASSSFGNDFTGGAAFGGFAAEGARARKGEAFVVGEKGPEVFVPDTAGTIVPNGGGMPRTFGVDGGSDYSVAQPAQVRRELVIGTMQINLDISAQDRDSFDDIAQEQIADNIANMVIERLG